jgi:hypothetical protein
MHIAVGVRSDAGRHHRYERGQRRRGAFQWKSVEQSAVHVRVKSRFGFHEVRPICLHRDAGCCRSELQRDLDASGYGGAYVHVLCIRSEPGRRHYKVIRVKRDVREAKCTVASGCRLPLVAAHGIRNLDRRPGNYSSGWIFYDTVNRSRISHLGATGHYTKQEAETQNEKCQLSKTH